MDIRQMALNMIANSPQLANNPQAQEYIHLIQTGDAQRGQEVARNICNTYGVSPDEAVANAKNFFHIPF